MSHLLPEAAVFVPMTVNDFIRRAEQVYGERTGVVDEPDQPAPSLGELTYAEPARRARPPSSACRSALSVRPNRRKP